MEDTNRCTYRAQLDALVLEASVDVADHGLTPARPMTCRVKFHLNGSDGLETDLSRGQLVVMLQFLQAIWVQIGGMGRIGPGDWKDVR